VKAIELFMWGYQPHFRILAQTAAEGIFNKLDRNLNPKVFLIGLLVENLHDRHPVCLEPEDCGYKPALFSDVKQQAEHFEAVDEERNIFHSHPIAQENHLRRLKDNALLKALEEVLSREDEHKGVVSFCSRPMLLEGYKVSVVLQIDRTTFSSYYSLSTTLAEERFTLKTSLIDATVEEYLKHCSSALTKPDPGRNLGIIESDHEDLIRSAGQNLMYSAAYAGRDLEGLHGLFNTCNTISSLRYEGAEGLGSLVIARQNHPNIESAITLASPVPIRSYRAVRKLLEVTSPSNCLLSDSAVIYGIGKVVGLYDYRKEDLFQIDFASHYTWDLLHAGHTLMRVEYRQPRLPQMRVDKEKFGSDFGRIFRISDKKTIENVWKLVLGAIDQKRGTMLVISGSAQAEAARLGNQCIRIKPAKMTPELLGMVSAIDGAVLIDAGGICHAIGVILDGLASKHGNSARGARYNSAIRYVEGRSECLAVVVSEDGSIDLVPDLRPQIRQSDVTRVVAKLKDICLASDIDVPEFNKTMSWLSSHKFYLSSGICQEVNELRHEVERRLKEKPEVRIVFENFAPNAEMNESYFLEEPN